MILVQLEDLFQIENNLSLRWHGFANVGILNMKK